MDMDRIKELETAQADMQKRSASLSREMDSLAREMLRVEGALLELKREKPAEEEE